MLCAGANQRRWIGTGHDAAEFRTCSGGAVPVGADRLLWQGRYKATPMDEAYSPVTTAQRTRREIGY